MKFHSFRIQQGLDHRWYVSHFGATVHSFPTQQQAEEFAKRWAKGNEPSIVRLEINGQVEKEWKFGEETPGPRSKTEK